MRKYICIDLKSFYASVECVERGLDPLSTNLLVADRSRTEKTICLALSPSLKALGLPGRPRLFQVTKRLAEVNRERLKTAPNRVFSGKSHDSPTLASHPELEISYITAPPRMALYMDYSKRVQKVYLDHVSPDDMHVYSVDEVFIDLTAYMSITGLSARDLTLSLIREVLKATGITATAGIGANLYLAKVAMDILAKRTDPDEDGVRIGELDEKGYREKLWSHRPITDFWRVGKGCGRKLERYGILTMGDVARCSLDDPRGHADQETLYRLFGVNAELLIDHAWGYEPCTIKDIKSYRPENRSLESGQVLQEPCGYEETKLIVWEMADQLSLDLTEKGLVTDQIALTIGYDLENLSEGKEKPYKGETVLDPYGRLIPKHSRGTSNIQFPTSSSRVITETALGLFERIAQRSLTVRRINITAGKVQKAQGEEEASGNQLDLFGDRESLEKERKIQKAILEIKSRFGKNAILKGASYLEGSRARDRNSRIGGHRA